MFDTAFILIDDLARPVLIIPEILPEGSHFLDIVADGIEIGANGQVLGAVTDIDEESLALLSLQPKIGMATHKGNPGDTMPDTIQYVATVTDKRAA